MDIRRVLIIAIIVTFMAVTVGHVAAYAGSFEAEGWQWLGWPYALGVDVAIALCAWFTRWKTTRRWAAAGYGLFVVFSGTMNVAAVRPWEQSTPVAAWVYALVPTTAIALLGFLLRQVEGLGAAKKYQLRLQLRRPAFLRAKEPRAPKKPKKMPQRIARISDWRAIAQSLDGKCAGLTADDAARLVQAAGLALPSRRTLQNWAHKAQEAA